MSMRFTMRRGDKMVYLELLIGETAARCSLLADALTRLHLTLL